MTWEELIKKHNYDHAGLIKCMPYDVRREMAKPWAGGAFVLDRMKVDLDKVDRLYIERFGQKGCMSRDKACMPEASKSFADFENDLGEEIANRAEVLAAMDCLMHHLKNEDMLTQWAYEIVPDGYNWNILDWDPAESAERTKVYMELAKSMSQQRFESCVHTFACIVRSEVFAEHLREGVFSAATSGGNP